MNASLYYFKKFFKSKIFFTMTKSNQEEIDMNFDIKKHQIIHKIKQNDKSYKGSIDVQIEHLIDLINNNKDYVTTSSCSGRISLYYESRNKNKKAEGKWLKLSHGFIDEIWLTDSLICKNDLEQIDPSNLEIDKMLMLRFEPVVKKNLLF